MKQILAILFLAFALTGCKSPERTAFITLGSVGATANAAIASYDSYSQTHAVPDAELVKVRAAVQQYLSAEEAARAAVDSYKSGAADRTAVDKALDAVSAASAQVVSLVNSFTTPK